MVSTSAVHNPKFPLTMKLDYPSHSRGKVRFRAGFLLFPKTINKETRWLEFARWVEIFGQKGLVNPNREVEPSWYTLDWEDNFFH
jgi:hypothetical protein